MQTDVYTKGVLNGLILVGVIWSIFAIPPTAGFSISYRNTLPNPQLLPERKWRENLIHARGTLCRSHRNIDISLDEDPELLEGNEITVDNSQTVYYVNEALIYDVCKLYRSVLGLDDFSVDVLFIDGETMRQENKATFGKDRPTDIISHASNTAHIKQDYCLNRSPLQSPEFRHLGGMLLCPEYINEKMLEKDQVAIDDDHGEHVKEPIGVAQRMRGVRDLNLRFCHLLAHGFLHLLGYDHVKDDDFAEMLVEEDKLLDKLFDHLRSKT